MAAVNGGSLVISVEADVAHLQAGITAASRAVTAGSEQMEAGARQAAHALEAVGDSGGAAAGKIDQSTSSMISDIQRTTAAMQAGGKSSSEYFRLLAGQRGVDADALRPYLDQLDAVSVRQHRTGVSAAQMQAALRQVPAQFTDIAVSIASGQQPLTVLLQQGGQLKDMFGGALPAARALGGYIVGLVNPYTLAAAAAAGLAYAYYVGSQEADGYTKALIQTNNAAGTSADAMATMAARIAETTGTQHAAAEALAALAGSGNVASVNLQRFAAVALESSDVTGTAVEEIAKQFSDLAKEPLKAALKLDESMRFLTASTYEQIESLEKQGHATEAANVAQNAYADTLAARTKEMQGNLGTIERSWNAIKDAVKGAGDALLDIGRKEPLAEQIAEKKVALARAKAHAGDFSQPSGLVAQLSNELAGLEADARRLQTDANRDAEREATRKSGITALKYLDDMTARVASNADKRKKEVEQYRRAVADLKAAGGGAEYTPERMKADEAKIADKYKDPKQPKPRKGPTSGGLNKFESAESSLDAAILSAQEYVKRLQDQYSGVAYANELTPGEKKLNELTERRKSLLENERSLSAEQRKNRDLELKSLDSQIAKATRLAEIEKQGIAIKQAAELRRQYETPLERLQREHGAAVRDITGNAQLSEEERQRLLGRENQRNQLSIDQVQNSVRGDLGMLSDTDKIVQAHQEMQRRISEAWAEGSQERVQAEVAAQRKLQQDMTALENQKASLILSMSGQVFDGLASMAEQAGGRQSAAYKLMFAMSKATAIAQAIINTEEAATKAMTLGPILGIPAASMVRGLGYASVGVMAAQAIQGMAHDGIDNIPREGTWLLDRGERVVDSRTNEDLKRYLARQNQGAQSGGAKLNVVINNNAGAQVDVQQGVGKDGAAQLIITMERVADSVYSRRQAADLRPGGVLSG
ncbi:phage tail tape measure protein [Pseudogulbenkiania sp. NH8B]|uniref:phage tail length tape measure family protein n=1 Tax=Pseudogulbenkiania sp. (strain NH8B) TaxID=748280 RepID=UPI0002279A99|nr:phage tail length tape measure family protein [Pseudogulbenkiania sp. NH8B]BAK75819.1 phage tail tape measure protein [Pseudogulbenkiania sp. NH8B]